MAQENLTYQGINRAPTDYVGLQACEELINMRPTQGGLYPVRSFGVKWADSAWARVWVHHTTDGDKHIAVVLSNATLSSSTYTATVSVKWVDPSTPLELFSYTVTRSSAADAAEVQQDIVDNLSYAAAGNVVLFSVCARDSKVFLNRSFTWKANSSGTLTYLETEANVPEVDFTFSDELAEATEPMGNIPTGSSPMDIKNTAETALNALQENNPDVCFGPVLVALAFKASDGNTFWTSQWRAYDPVPVANTSENYVDSDTPLIPEYYEDFFTKYGHGYLFFEVGKAMLAGTKVTLTFPKIGTTQNPWDKDKSILESVEVYASRPAVYVDADAAGEGYYEDEDHAYVVFLPQRSYSAMDLASQPLYHQATISLESLASEAQTVSLSFGGNVQVTSETLDVDAGATRRYGKLLSYNARFHYYASVAHTDLGLRTGQSHDVVSPAFLFSSSSSTARLKVYCRYTDNEQSSLVYVGQTAALPYDRSAYLVVAPSAGISEVVTYVQVASPQTPYRVVRYRMTPSTTYNYSVCTENPNPLVYTSAVTELESLASAGYGGLERDEKAAINVTEQYNPFVFRVEHSYLAPGNVLDVQPQMSVSVDNSYGTDPLDVFTTRGIYALTQGSANVLYGAFVPVSNLVVRKGVPTEAGIFFLSAGSLWLLVGRRLTLVSDALSRGPNKYVRDCPGYKLISGGGLSAPQYDVSSAVSAVTFETFTETGSLSYNRLRDEIYVANPSYDYTYVLSLKYRQWFKFDFRIAQDEAGSTLAWRPSLNYPSTRRDYLDLEVEIDAHPTVHMQSRPFSMAWSYCHVHRIVQMARAALSGTNADLLVTALYGSDDLHNWQLLAYAKRNGSTATSGGETVDVPLKISQIRTPSAARSWRYYTVCTGGKVPSLETELGPVAVDYDPVIRRIG